MDDQRIIELFLNRDEQAIRETTDKYGAFIRKIAGNILGNREDVEECVNDILFRIWNTIPPNRPKTFYVYLAIVSRQVSIDAYRRNHRKKRTATEYTLSYEELSEIFSSGRDNTTELIDLMTLQSILKRFLSERPKAVRTVLILRYFYMESMKDIAERTGFSESRVKGILHRERKTLKAYLEKEGYGNV